MCYKKCFPSISIKDPSTRNWTIICISSISLLGPEAKKTNIGPKGRNERNSKMCPLVVLDLWRKTLWAHLWHFYQHCRERKTQDSTIIPSQHYKLNKENTNYSWLGDESWLFFLFVGCVENRNVFLYERWALCPLTGKLYGPPCVTFLYQKNTCGSRK